MEIPRCIGQGQRDDCPDDASLRDIQYRTYVRQKIDQGRKDKEAGNLLSQNEVELRVSRWLDENRAQ